MVTFSTMVGVELPEEVLELLELLELHARARSMRHGVHQSAIRFGRGEDMRDLKNMTDGKEFK